MTTGYITRKHKFDAGHRVMHERVKCFNNHGHEYKIELTMAYDDIHSIGYAVDFKEIKRMGMSFIDKRFDHAAIHNPHDVDFIAPCEKHKTKIHLMNLMGAGNYCNPSAENIAKELFYAFAKLLDNPTNCNLRVHSIRLWETENCFVTCYRETLTLTDWFNLDNSEYAKAIQTHKNSVGQFEYDSRKANDNLTEEDLSKIDN